MLFFFVYLFIYISTAKTIARLHLVIRYVVPSCLGRLHHIHFLHNQIL